MLTLEHITRLATWPTMHRQNGLHEVFEAAEQFRPRPPLQSISTRDIPATNTKPARIRATASGGVSMIVSRHCMSDYFNAHAHAARMLADSLDWADEFIPGATRDGYCFVIDCGVRI